MSATGAIELSLAKLEVPGREARHREAVRVVGLLGDVECFLPPDAALQEAPKLSEGPDKEAAREDRWQAGRPEPGPASRATYANTRFRLCDRQNDPLARRIYRPRRSLGHGYQHGVHRM